MKLLLPNLHKYISLCYEYGLERILPMNIYNTFKTWKCFVICSKML
jgi:hypothetical protein